MKTIDRRKDFWRTVYTSLGAPQDMQLADVRRLLVNAVKWTLESDDADEADDR